MTAPTSFPSWIIGEPLTLMSSRGQKNFVFFCGFYAFLQVKGRFLHTSSAILNLTLMNCRKRGLLNFLAFSTNSDICRTLGFSFYIAKASDFSGGFLLHLLHNGVKDNSICIVCVTRGTKENRIRIQADLILYVNILQRRTNNLIVSLF